MNNKSTNNKRIIVTPIMVNQINNDIESKVSSESKVSFESFSSDNATIHTPPYNYRMDTTILNSLTIPESKNTSTISNSNIALNIPDRSTNIVSQMPSTQSRTSIAPANLTREAIREHMLNCTFMNNFYISNKNQVILFITVCIILGFLLYITTDV